MKEFKHKWLKLFLRNRIEDIEKNTEELFIIK